MQYGTEQLYSLLDNDDWNLKTNTE
jgi:hypothetical protein